MKLLDLISVFVWFLVRHIFFCKSSHVASHCTIWVNKIPSIVYWLTQSKPEYKGSNKPTKPASKIISQDWSKLSWNCTRPKLYLDVGVQKMTIYLCPPLWIWKPNNDCKSCIRWSKILTIWMHTYVKKSIMLEFSFYVMNSFQ